mgnify:CR=1 FL=1
MTKTLEVKAILIDPSDATTFPPKSKSYETLGGLLVVGGRDYIVRATKEMKNEISQERVRKIYSTLQHLLEDTQNGEMIIKKVSLKF